MSKGNFLTHCSFCEQPRDDTALIIGPEISICADCTVTAVASLVKTGTRRMMTVAVGRPPDPKKSWDDFVREQHEASDGT